MPQGYPTVSVVIPTYNRAYTIGRAIQSVLKQSYQDFEIIVVDDGSTDNTPEVVKRFQESDKRIRYIRHECNRGASAARNSGIRTAVGRYIGFLDDDDEWLPEKLKKQVNVFDSLSLKVGVVYTGLWRLIGSRRVYLPFDSVKCREGNIHSELLKWDFMGTPSLMVRRSCFEDVGLFDEDFRTFEDWELLIRVSRFYEFKYIDVPLAISYFTKDSLSSNKDAVIEALKLILKKHFSDFSGHRIYLARLYYSIGSALCQRDRVEEGRPYIIKAMKVYPFNFKYLLALFISALGRNMYGRFARLKRRLWPAQRLGE